MQYIQIKYMKFAAVSCSLWEPFQNTGGCPASTLEHFQILTPLCPKRSKTHKNFDLWYFMQCIQIKYIKIAAVSCSLGGTSSKYRMVPGRHPWAFSDINPLMPKTLQNTHKMRFMQYIQIKYIRFAFPYVNSYKMQCEMPCIPNNNY